MSTVWKIQIFNATQIFRESNFRDFTAQCGKVSTLKCNHNFYGKSIIFSRQINVFTNEFNKELISRNVFGEIEFLVFPHCDFTKFFLFSGTLRLSPRTTKTNGN